MGHNHPKLWDEVMGTTYSQPITQFKKNTENNIRFANQALSRGPEFNLSKANLLYTTHLAQLYRN
jgi:hypothetical protein